MFGLDQVSVPRRDLLLVATSRSSSHFGCYILGELSGRERLRHSQFVLLSKTFYEGERSIIMFNVYVVYNKVNHHSSVLTKSQVSMFHNHITNKVAQFDTADADSLTSSTTFTIIDQQYPKTEQVW